MEFINKLDKEQMENAALIGREAKSMGIDPRLAVSLAYQESKLRNLKEPGAAGEIGIMQIKPATADLVGFSKNDIATPLGNIRAGLTYLKSGIDKFNDPVLAVAGYNTGYNHPFFTDPSKGLPETTQNYIKSIQSLGGFSATPQEPKPETSSIGSGSVEVSEKDLAQLKARGLTDVLGAGTGAVAAKGMQVGSDVLGGARALANMARQAPPTGGLPAGMGSGEKWLTNWGGMEKPGFTGGVPQAAAQYNKMKPQGQIMSGLVKRGMITPEPVVPGQPPRPQLSISGQAPAAPGGLPSAPRPAAMGNVLRTAGSSPVLSGALGGLSAAEAGQELHKRYQQKDVPGMIGAGVGVGGGLLSLVPNPITRGVGMGMSAASPLSLYLMDKMRGRIPNEPITFSAEQQPIAP